MTDRIVRKNESLTRAVICAAVIVGLTAQAGCAPSYRAPFLTEKGVTFKVLAPMAKQVNIAGSFNRWDRAKDALSGPDPGGWWSITLPLGPGRHEYLFLIDSAEWLVDPYGEAVADDGFGGKNSVLHLHQ